MSPWISRRIPSAAVCLAVCLLSGALSACTPAAAPAETTLTGAEIQGEPIYYPSMGDLWMATWADDDRLFLSWGDGTGFGDGFPTGFPAYTSPDPVTVPACGEFEIFCTLWCNIHVCSPGELRPAAALTDAGVLSLFGPVPDFTGAELAAIDVPSGEPFFLGTGAGIEDVQGRNDKPSSLLFLDGRLIFAGHYPAGEPVAGYLSFSGDYGQTWQEVPGTPWGADSSFRVLMFIQMGRAYDLNRDGFVYALGIGSEAGWLAGTVRLARVPRDAVTEYAAYEYFSGLNGGEPTWSADESRAAALPGLQAQLQGAAMYHEGTGQFLFMTASSVDPPGGAGGLYAAPQPWGPWRLVSELCFDFGCGEPSAWVDGKYIAGLIPKDVGPDTVYFTISGGDDHYQLQIGMLSLITGESPGP